MLAQAYYVMVESKSDRGRVPSWTIFLDNVTHAEFNELFYKYTFLEHFLVGLSVNLPKLRTMFPFYDFSSFTAIPLPIARIAIALPHCDFINKKSTISSIDSFGTCSQSVSTSLLMM